MINRELLVGKSAMAVTAAITAARSWTGREKIPPITAAAAPVFRIGTFQLIFSAFADTADFTQLSIFGLDAIHIFSGPYDGRKTSECPSWIFSGPLGSTNLNIHEYQWSLSLSRMMVNGPLLHMETCI